MNEFITWTTLGTYGGAVAMVMMLTQFTKGLGIIDKIPTQGWSYILSFLVLICAMAFTDGITINTFMQTIFNALIVSVGSNGGYDLVQKLSNKALS